jgi:hypothetical protein
VKTSEYQYEVKKLLKRTTIARLPERENITRLGMENNLDGA